MSFGEIPSVLGRKYESQKKLLRISTIGTRIVVRRKSHAKETCLRMDNAKDTAS